MTVMSSEEASLAITHVKHVDIERVLRDSHLNQNNTFLLVISIFIVGLNEWVFVPRREQHTLQRDFDD